MDTRLAVYALILRELVHRALARVVTEPWLHDKRRLARHAHDDAELVARLLARLQTPAPALAVIGEHDPYASVKPGLAGAVRDHLAETAPDDPDAQLLSDIATLQELHAAELPARWTGAPFALDPDAGTPLTVDPAPVSPAREPFVLTGRETPGAHARMHRAIIAAEIAARTAHEAPDRGWSFHADVVRIAADRLASTHRIDGELEREGTPWGTLPVDLTPFAVGLRRPLAGRLQLAADPDDPGHAAILRRHV